MSNSKRGLTARTAAYGLTVAIAVLLTESIVHAQSKVIWDGGGDGSSFHDRFNWSEDVEPGFADRAVFDTAGGSINFSYPSPVNYRLEVQNADVTFNFFGYSYRTTSDLWIAERDGVSASLTLVGGHVEVSQLLEVGLGMDTSADLLISNGCGVSSTVGVLGSAPSATGSVTVGGEGSQWINILGMIVGSSGTASLNISNGGWVLDATGIIGFDVGSAGTVTVDGTGSSWDNTLDLLVGREGWGSLSIANGASVSNTAGFIGAFAGSDGSVTVDGAGSNWASLTSLTVGNFGTGTLTVSEGGIVMAPVITIGDTGEVHGDGGVLAGNVVNDGLLSPGGSIGTLTIDGYYEQTTSGILDIELDDPPDLLSVNGQAILAGALNLSLADGFTPPPTQEITILTADTIVGTFDVQTCQAQFNL
ncbi:MAG: hypothetical protein ACYS0G_15985, partial [Planctomycetota bacterium]